MSANGTEKKKTLFIEAIATGKSLSDAALCVGINKQTARRWIENESVCKRIEERQAQIIRDSRYQAVGILPKSMDCISGSIESGDTRAALQVAKGLGIFREYVEERNTVAIEIDDATLSKITGKRNGKA